MARLGNPQARYEPAKFSWIGRIHSSSSVTMVWHTSKTMSLDDAKRSEVVLSATGAGSTGSLYPSVMNEVLKTRFKLVQGYKGTHEAMLAMERGEAEGHSTTWEAVKSVNMRWVKEGHGPHPRPARPQPRARPAGRADLGRARDVAGGPRGDARHHGRRRDRQVLFHHAGRSAPTGSRRCGAPSTP